MPLQSLRGLFNQAIKYHSVSRCSRFHGNIPIIAHKHKLTRCGSRDAETAEEEQGKSLHLSNARTTCGPIYSGRRRCVTRQQCRVLLLSIHVSSCVSSRLQQQNNDGLSAAFQHLGQRSERRLRSFNSRDCPLEPPATSVIIHRSSSPGLFRLRRRSSNCAPKPSLICCCW